MRQLDIIEADHRQILRKTHSQLTRLVHRAQRHQIAMAEQGFRRLRQAHQLLQRAGTGFKGKVAVHNQRGIDGDIAAAQRLDVALQPILAERDMFRSGDAGDLPMAQL